MAKDQGKAVTESINISKEDLIDIIKAVKAPTEQEQAVIDAENASMARQRADSARRQVEAAEAEKRRFANCNHRQNEGRSREHYSIGGQEHSDGFIHPVCSRCQKSFPLITVPPELKGQAIEPSAIADVLIQMGELRVA